MIPLHYLRLREKEQGPCLLFWDGPKYHHTAHVAKSACPHVGVTNPTWVAVTGGVFPRYSHRRYSVVG